MAVDKTVKTYRGTRAKKGVIAIKQLPKKETLRLSTTLKNVEMEKQYFKMIMFGESNLETPN